LYTCLASSRLALLKPEPYVVRLYRRPTLPTEFLSMVGFLIETHSGVDKTVITLELVRGLESGGAGARFL
jgi:hypothetical protein